MAKPIWVSASISKDSNLKVLARGVGRLGAVMVHNHPTISYSIMLDHARSL
ncbi:hypothetical protein [Bradyrhizobium sp. 143]|uniref:hypothetical protein n=1 Tax=Bradyrhizobium sp. 143 TaxID=2782619 RepID=UPI00036080B7|nr:hypothetical protein [Bradyrhizobium sp. 143]MCK1712877.1 hypothetical protein [Bradyrhizobium sp. 143]